ncbi:MAG TPA: HupE/UreJ family protein [Methylomirabilota bacterium]|jgi:hydrogenase/urease accessory protein HupE
MPRWRLVALGVILGPLAAQRPAEAHLVTTGLGPVYDGLVHFAVTPEDLVPAIALALLAGMQGVTHGRRALFALPAAWLLGGLLGLSLQGAVSTVATAVSFVLLGALVATDTRLPLIATTALAALLGVFHGCLNGLAMARPGLGALSMLGIVAGVFIVAALVTSFVVPLRAAWARTVVRVAGSWIVAVGLLQLAWALRPGV